MNTFDRNLFLAMNFDGGAWMDAMMWFASGKLSWLPLYLLILWLIWHRYGWKTLAMAVLFVAVGVALSDQICNLFKSSIPCLRPTHTEEIAALIHTVREYRGGLYGTVSAHAATTMFVCCFTVPLIRRRWFSIVMTLWVVLVCYSRIYLGAHFPLQILFGLLTGGLVAYGLRILWKRLSCQFRFRG